MSKQKSFKLGELAKLTESIVIGDPNCIVDNLSTIVKTVALSEGPDNLVEGRFNLIRRANDLSQTSKFIPSPQVGKHDDDIFGTHHARDAVELFKTKNLDLNLFSSAMIINSQYMHCLLYTSPSPRDRQKSRMPSSA